jgi:hypothetical protein
VSQATEIALLRQYRSETVAVKRQIRDLLHRRDALVQAINGLESVLRVNGIDPDQIDAAEDSPPSETDASAATARVSSDDSPRPALVNAAIATLESANAPIGAKELHAALLRRGISANYYTLYKSLDRESKRGNGLIVRVKDKFALRRSANNDIDA